MVSVEVQVNEKWQEMTLGKMEMEALVEITPKFKIKHASLHIEVQLHTTLGPKVFMPTLGHVKRLKRFGSLRCFGTRELGSIRFRLKARLTWV